MSLKVSQKMRTYCRHEKEICWLKIQDMNHELIPFGSIVPFVFLSSLRKTVTFVNLLCVGVLSWRFTKTETDFTWNERKILRKYRVRHSFSHCDEYSMIPHTNCRKKENTGKIRRIFQKGINDKKSHSL